MILICNNMKATSKLLDELEFEPNQRSSVRLENMRGTCQLTLDQLQQSNAWTTAVALIKKYG